MPSERCYLYERHVSIPSEFLELFAALVMHGEVLAGEELLWRATGPVSVYVSNTAVRTSLLPRSSVPTFFLLVGHGLLLSEHSQVHPAPSPFALGVLLRTSLKASKAGLFSHWLCVRTCYSNQSILIHVN